MEKINISFIEERKTLGISLRELKGKEKKGGEIEGRIYLNLVKRIERSGVINLTRL
jgi:hypothetical protein